MLAAVDEKVEAGEVARDATAEEAPAEPQPPAAGAQVIDLAELLSRSIKGAAKPGPAKTKGDESESKEEAKPEKGKAGTKKKRATG